MRTVVVSDNPLFVEVMKDAAQCCLCEFIPIPSGLDGQSMLTLAPDLLIIDETTSTNAPATLLLDAAHLAHCRILLVNLLNNDLVTVDAIKSTICQTADLQRAMRLEVAQP